MGRWKAIVASLKNTAPQDEQIYFPFGRSSPTFGPNPTSRKGNVFESEFERNLFELRKGKLAEIEKLGHAVYPNQFPFTHTIPEIRARWNDATAESLDAG